MPLTDQLMEEERKHQLLLEKRKKRIARATVISFNKGIEEIIQEIEDSSYSTKRELSSLLTNVRRMNSKLFEDLYQDLQDYLTTGFISEELEHELRVLERSTVDEEIKVPEEDSLVAPLLGIMFLGASLKQHLTTIRNSTFNLIKLRIVQAQSNGEPLSSAITSIKGTRKNKYRDGILKRQRAKFITVTDSWIQASSTKTSDKVHQVNPFITMSIYLAVLDERTTDRCRSLNGNIYPVGEGVFPPQHYYCRSRRVPYS